jgi:glycosyltransferase involved in cell wall biosynthesis
MGAHVCCLVRAIPENMETGGDGVLYFNGGIEDLVNKWRMVSEDTEILNKYASKGYERVVSHFDWDVVTTQYCAAYNEIVDDMSG